ncbi:MAG TPA: type II secretion system protein GspD [Planctomycetes bacterium]|nr:type II secretion system protein GspD [Planctomycetota bacterium]
MSAFTCVCAMLLDAAIIGAAEEPPAPAAPAAPATAEVPAAPDAPATPEVPAAPEAPVAPVVPAAPAPPAGSEAAAGGEPAPQPGAENGIWLNFKDAPIDTVLAHLSEVAGLIIVTKEDGFKGRVTVQNRQRLEVDEALSVVNSVLRQEGFAAIRVGRTLTVVKLSEAAKANTPVRVGSDPAGIPETLDVITQVMPLRRVEARQLLQDLRALFSEETNVAANQVANALIITDASVNIRRIAQVVWALDSADPSTASVEVFPLKYAEATDAARLVNQIFQTTATSGRSSDRGFTPFFQRGGPGGPFGGPGGPGGAGGTGGTGSSGSGQAASRIQVNASADERTNTVVVSGPPETLKVVGQVLKDLDSNPASKQEVFFYRVRNGQAIQIETVLNNLFGTGSTSSRSRTQSGTRGTSTTSGGRSSGALRTSGGGRGGSDMGGGMADAGGGRGGGMAQAGGSGQGGFGAAGRGAGGRLSSQSMESASELYGQVYAVADEDTNALLVTSPSGAVEIVKGIIKELDTPVPQVLIKVLIAEVTHTDELDIGNEFSLLEFLAKNDMSLFTDFGIASQPYGMVYKYINKDAETTLRMLAKDSKLEVLSRPYILASDNQEASITVGQEVPFITNTRQTSNDATINTIEYQDVGIILNVTPHTNPDGIVTLDVEPEISAISGDTVPISETVNAPVIAKRSALSRLAIPDGHTVVIGGLMEDSVTETFSKVPLLGDIPLLGWLFGRMERKKSKTELLIFLTPHVAKDPYVLRRMSEREKERITIVDRAIHEGVFDSHIEGMQGVNPPSEPPEAAGEDGIKTFDLPEKHAENGR